MGLAGAAEVLVTSTVRDLVSGSDATFEDRGLHELKGVEGSRQVFSLTAVEMRLPQPLSPEEAAERLAHVVPVNVSRRARVALVVAGVIVLVAAAAAGGVLAFRGGAVQRARRSPPARRGLAGTSRRRCTAPRSDENPTLWYQDGTLWQMKGASKARLVARDPASGESRVSIPLGVDPCNCKIAFGFGSVWLAKNRLATMAASAGTTRWVIQRIDELSGKRLKTFRLPADAVFGAIATGNGAVWVLQTDGTLLRIDPANQPHRRPVQDRRDRDRHPRGRRRLRVDLRVPVQPGAPLRRPHANGTHVQDRRERVHRSGRRSEGDAVRSRERDGDGDGSADRARGVAGWARRTAAGRGGARRNRVDRRRACRRPRRTSPPARSRRSTCRRASRPPGSRPTRPRTRCGSRTAGRRTTRDRRRRPRRHEDPDRRPPRPAGRRQRARHDTAHGRGERRHRRDRRARCARRWPGRRRRARGCRHRLAGRRRYRAGVVTLAANVPGFEGRVELARLVSEQLDGVPGRARQRRQRRGSRDMAARRRPPVQEPARRLGRHRRRGRARARRPAVHRPRRGRRVRPHGRPAEWAALRLRTPRVRRGLRRTRKHGAAGAPARQARPQDEPVQDHGAPRPGPADLGSLRQGARGRRRDGAEADPRRPSGRSVWASRRRRTSSTWRRW